MKPSDGEGEQTAPSSLSEVPAEPSAPLKSEMEEKEIPMTGVSTDPNDAVMPNSDGTKDTILPLSAKDALLEPTEDADIVQGASVEEEDTAAGIESSTTDLFDSSSSSSSESEVEEHEPEPVKVLTQKRKLGRPPLNKSPLPREKVKIESTASDVASGGSDNEEEASERKRPRVNRPLEMAAVTEEEVPRKKRGRPASVQPPNPEKAILPKQPIKDSEKSAMTLAGPGMGAITERLIGGRGGRGRGSGLLGSGRGRGRKSNSLSSMGKEAKPLSMRDLRRSRERALLPTVFSTPQDVYRAFTAINYMVRQAYEISA